MMKLGEMRSIAIPAWRAFRVKRLDVLGCTARCETDAGSDVDPVVKFEELGEQAAARFFGLLHHLEDHLQCRLDLLTSTGVRNPSRAHTDHAGGCAGV